ncbi:MAG: hypothetical protein NBKEAIPA_02832 [Nitrospirae bacterium]|nr:hypothetical protein [Nitrospirota bacterium]
MQVVLEDLEVRGVIIHDQDMAVPEAAFIHMREGGAAGKPHRDGEPECCSLVGPADQPDLAAHQVNQLLHDRQSQTGSPESAGGRSIRLRKGGQESSLGCLWNPDSCIAHLAPEDDRGLMPLDKLKRHGDLPLRREFDGIADEVQDDLAET